MAVVVSRKRLVGRAFPVPAAVVLCLSIETNTIPCSPKPEQSRQYPVTIVTVNPNKSGEVTWLRLHNHSIGMVVLTGATVGKRFPRLSTPNRRSLHLHTAVGRSKQASHSHKEFQSVWPLCAVVDDRHIPLEQSNDVHYIPSSPYNGKTAIVVGAGPCGSLAGVLLAKRGFNVKIFEKRGDPSCIPETNQRSIPNVLNPEVTRYLEELGFKLATEESEEGLHQFKSIYGTEPETGCLREFTHMKGDPRRILADRHLIASSILKMGMSDELPNIEFHFNAECQGADIASKTVKFLTQEGKTNEVAYDLLIGADGVHSKVREALQASGHMKFTQKTTPRKSISIRNLPVPQDASAKGLLEDLRFGCIAFGETVEIEGIPMRVVAYKTRSGFQVLFSGNRRNWRELIKGKELETVAQVAPAWFPKEWFELIADRIVNGRASAIGPVTYCSSFIGPNVALLGDACHSATPALGIGSNRAILDARDLDDAFGNAAGDVTQALRTYDEKCRPQVNAIQQLELFNPDSAIEGPRPLLAAFFSPYSKFHAQGRKFLPGLMPANGYILMACSFISPRQALRRYQYFAFGVAGGALVIFFGSLFLLLRLI